MEYTAMIKYASSPLL